MIISRHGGSLELLTRDELYDIHLASMDVLEHTGVVVMLDEALRLLDNLGASVDYKTKRALIPSDLVKEAIQKTPSSFVLYARNPKNKLRVGGNRVYFLDGGLTSYVVDLAGIRRPATIKDVEDLTRLYDFLDNVDMLAAGVFPTDVPEKVQHVHAYLKKLENTEKVCLYVYFARGGVVANDLIEMASIVAGGPDELRKKPMIMGWENPISPMSHGKEQTEMVLEFAKRGLPVHIGPAIQSGSTGPVTLAGVLVQQNVEVLSGIVIAQSVTEQGRRSPIVYGAVPALTDVRYGTTVYGAAEAALMNIASAQIARYYSLPCRGNGGATESKTEDIQAGYESAITLLMASLAGANLIMNATGGALEPGIGSMSYEKAVIDNDMATVVSRILKGIDVSDNTLAVEVLEEVGPLGHFLSHKHTREFFKKEHIIPPLADRRDYTTWRKDGSKELKRVARETASKILQEHKPAPLEDSIKKELEAIVKKVEKRELT